MTEIIPGIYATPFNRRATPIPGLTQVGNSSRGYSWQVDDRTRFDRLLIFGAKVGTH